MIEKIDILKEIQEIRTMLIKISDSVASNSVFAKGLHPEYLIEKFKNIKADADYIIGQIRYRAKEVMNEK